MIRKQDWNPNPPRRQMKYGSTLIESFKGVGMCISGYIIFTTEGNVWEGITDYGKKIYGRYHKRYKICCISEPDENIKHTSKKRYMTYELWYNCPFQGNRTMFKEEVERAKSSIDEFKAYCRSLAEDYCFQVCL